MFAKIILLINLILIFIVIICERKSIKAIVFWGIVTFLFFGLGFIAYIIFGNRLKFKAKRELQKKQKTTKNYLKLVKWYKCYNKKNKLELTYNQNKISVFLKNKFGANIWHNNKICIFTNGQNFLKNLLKDLQNAKYIINMQFYIFASDSSGKMVADVLKQKAKSGVVVNVLYDAVGCKQTSKNFFNSLKQAGVNVYEFFPGFISYINLKINYRNHRKIVVIDGKVSYVGGINIRDDHMGHNFKLNPWRDTAIRIYGSASYALNDIFLNDWSYASSCKIDGNNLEQNFPKINLKSGVPIQIIQSGADKKYNQIEECYIKIIKTSKTFLYIQSPYFILNNKIIDELLTAKKRGVDIKIIIPQKPDKKIVYAGTLKCIKQILDYIPIFLYKGFIHSKVILSESVLSVGSANFDYRSLNLNFEANALIYSNDKIEDYKRIFKSDIKNSIFLTKKLYKKICKSNIVFNLTYGVIKQLL